MGLTKIETTTFPRFPASFRARRTKAAWPSCSAPIVGTKTTGRSASAQYSRADVRDFAILTVPAEKEPYETVEKPTHVTREIFGADIGGETKEHPLKGL
jgi:hypothetical protein